MCLRASGNLSRAFCWCVLLCALSSDLFAASAKRVLVVHSFGNAAPPFTTHSIAFETELTAKLGEPVDLDEVYLDVARYATLDMEEALVEFVQKRQMKWQPDLVIPIGSPAGVFVARHRAKLFPKTVPVIYTGMDKRRLPTEAFENAGFVGEDFDLPGLVEDILELAPNTKNIGVVIGASPLENFWLSVLQSEYARFTNRVNFTWFNDLTLEQMLDRAAKMPPDSFLLLILLMRDAAGVTHNADEALKKLHAVANAPINGIFVHQLGLGIVGGRLYQAETEGIESARIAVAVLRGNAVTNFPPRIIGPVEPSYDWRELQRWNLDEARLPAGANILFREPTFWQRYKGRIITAILVFVAEAVLIFLLAANLVKRRRAERSVAETEARFRHAADAAPVMLWMSGTDKLCTFFNKPWLEFRGRKLEQELGNGWAEGVHAEDIKRCLDIYTNHFDARRGFTMEYRLRRGNGEYGWVQDHGVPRFTPKGEFLGYVGTVSDVTELKEAEERWRAVVESAPNTKLVIDSTRSIVLANARAETMFGYSRAELADMAVEALMPTELLNVEIEAGIRTFQELGPGADGVHVAGRRKDGANLTLEVSVSSMKTAHGEFFLASIIDITERLAAEARMRETEARMMLASEVAHLGMWTWDPPEPILWTSPQWRWIHGYSPDEGIRFESLLERVHPEDREQVGRIITEACSQQRSFYVQHRIILPGGKVRWMSKSGRVEPRGKDGRVRVLGFDLDITEQKLVEAAAIEVSGKLITAQEDERRRIARDLHDDLNQRLAMLSVEADLLGRMDQNEKARPLIEDIASQVKDLSSEVHKLSYRLHPSKLEQLGLIAATRSLCGEHGKQCGVAVEFTYDEVPRDLNRDIALCLYRIVQETLRNMARHSGATEALVNIACSGEEIKLLIADNGRGFELPRVARHAGLGLVGMRERVRLVHGAINVDSAPGKGTRIEVRVPLPLSDK